MTIRTQTISSFLWLALAGAATAAPDPGGDDQRSKGLAFERLGSGYPGSLGVDPTGTLTELLDSGYVRFELGQFDLRYPAPALADEENARRFVDICAALVGLELEWLAWRATSSAGIKDARKLAKGVTKWIRRWKTSDLKSLAESEELDLLTAVSSKEKDLAALSELNALLTSGEVAGLSLAGRDRAQLVFSPDRENFIAVASFVGLCDPHNRDAYWHDGIIAWTDFWWNDVNVIALEYPPVDPNPDTLYHGIDMNGREKTGLLEHVLQRAAYSLCWRTFGRDLDPAFESGLAQNLVIAVVGQNNCRSGGSTKGKVTSAYSRFVPGGNSNGGFLPKNNADSTWRADLGSDHFIDVLKNSQDSGAPRRGDKLASFVLTSPDAGQTVVTAPFLGTPALGKELPPEAFLSDYREFFRAYKSCFAHWLRTEAGKDATESFARLLNRMGDESAGDELEPMLEEVYGLPLSAASGDEESLEWRFLKWLSKQ